MNDRIFQSRCIVDVAMQTPVLQDLHEPDLSRFRSGSLEYLRTGVAGDSTVVKLNSRRAYTLIEVLVVVVVIVLMLGMALPVFRAITGSRSEAGASNVIASTLGRARTDALGIQKPYGVAFMYNPSTQQTTLAEVYFPSTGIWSGATGSVGIGSYVTATVSGQTTYYINDGTGPVQPDGSVTVPLTVAPTSPPTQIPIPGLREVGGPPVEIVPDSDLISLPGGIGVQTIYNCSFNNAAQRQSDGYLSMGVILFDSKGRLHAYNYGISAYSKLAKAALSSNGSLNLDYPKVLPYPGIYSGTGLGVTSQFGLVVFQREAWANQRAQIPNQGTNPTYSDALYLDATPASTTTALSDYSNGTPTPMAEENWLDQNATPLLIDRYTGTLIKGE